MHLNDNDQARWNAVTADAHLLERQDPHLKIKTEFRMSDPQIKSWMQDVLAPSLMEAEEGVATCLASVESEKDAVVRALKVNIIEHWWDMFPKKTPKDVVAHFRDNGVETDTLRHMVVESHYPPEHTQADIDRIRHEIAEEHGIDPEDIIVELDGQDKPTVH